MSRDKTYQILLIAGNYDVVQSVQRALPPSRFSISNAFSHRDASYMLSQSRYDALVVDSAMSDRHSGKLTMAMLTEVRPEVPLIALAAPGSGLGNGAFINASDQQAIQTTVMRALNISTLPRGSDVKVTTNLNKSVESRRADEINTLFALSKSLTEVLDLSEVLNRVVEAARDLTNAEEGMILLPEGEELYLRAKVGVDVESARNFRIKTRDAIIGDVYKTGQPTLVGDSGPQKVKTEYFVNSMLYVPIMLQGEIIGVLGVNNKQKKDAFDIHHQELLMNLASFAAVAIENARVHEESLGRSRELETLVAASEAVNSSLELAETLPNVCKQFAMVLNVGYAELFDWRQDFNHLRTMARFYEAGWRFGYGPKLDIVRHPAINAAFENDRPRWLKVQDRAYPAEIAYLQQVGAEAVLIVPLYYKGQALGALRVFFIQSPNPPPPQEIIQRVRSIAMEGLVDLLNRTDRIMSSNLLNLATQVNQLVHSDWCELSLRMKDSTILMVLARIGAGVWLNRPQPVFDLNRHPDITRLMEAQATIALHEDDPRLTPSGRAILDLTQGRSVLGLPLVQRGKTKGLVIFSDSERRREFTPREIDMARAIVGQAATALENAKLVHDLEKSLQELKETQNRLIQTARLSAMGELAAVVAHQINNPLTTIIVDTELMLMDEPAGSPNHSALTAISRAGKRAANVARRLLAIARPTDPDAPADLIDVVDTIRGILSLVQTHIERSNIRLEATLPDDPVPGVMAIKGSLDDVWLNMVMNAHDALVSDDTPNKDKLIQVQVRHVPEKRGIEVMIRDNGTGIPAEIQGQIFSPFFTTKPVGEGTGLGLHVCKEVVENCGGTITVESVVGEYTCFIVNLPAANA